MAEYIKGAYEQVQGVVKDVQDNIDKFIGTGIDVNTVHDKLAAELDTFADGPAFSAWDSAVTWDRWTDFTHIPSNVSYDHTGTEINVNKTETTVMVGASDSKYGDLVALIDDVKGKIQGINLSAPNAPSMPAIDNSPIERLNMPGQKPGAFDFTNTPALPEAYAGMVDNPVAFPTLERVSWAGLSYDGFDKFTEEITPFDTSGKPTADSFQWNDRAYTERFLPRVSTTINRVMDDGLGLAPGVETALFDRARAREDQIAQRAIKDTFDVFASRGFSMPPGMQVAMVKQITDENQLKLREFSREVYIKRVEMELDQLKFAVQQGIAAEQMSFEVFKTVTQLAFEFAKAKLAFEADLFKQEVEIYGMRLKLYETKAAVHAQVVNAQLKALDADKIVAEVEGLKAQYNETQVKAYTAGWEAVRANVTSYSAYVEGLSKYNVSLASQVGVYQAQWDGWKTEVEGEMKRVEADISVKQLEKLKGELYDSEVKAYLGYVQAMTQKADGFTRLVQGYSSAADHELKHHELDLAKDKLQLEYNKVSAELDIIVEQSKMKISDDELQHGMRESQLKLDLEKSGIDAALAKWKAENSQTEERNQKRMESYRMWSDLMKMKVEALSRTLQGALSTLHFQESASGSASISGSGGTSVSYNYSGDVNSDVDPTTSA